MHAPRRRRCRRLRRRARHRVAPPRTAPQPPRRRGHCDVYATLRRQMPQRRPLRRRQPSPPRPSRQRACACTCHRLRPPAPSSAPPVPYRRPPHPLRKQQRHARGARAAREVYHSQKRACSLRTPLARPPTLGRGATSRRRAARAAVACPAPLPQLRPLVTLGVGYRLPEREVPAPQPRFRPAPSRGSAAVRRPPHRRLPRPRRTPTRAHAAQAPPSRSPARWQQPPRAPHPRWLLQGRTAMP
mmetsp:Transcript_20366/g.63145  ORF Transcript_20366/g.63145 Transcript_20366/m.63145 type:complete len:243 (+) Transcript_20366:325-1053(+)